MIKCKDCEISYPDQNKLQAHVIEKHSTFCKVCQKDFASRKGLLLHERRFHREIHEWQCNICKTSLTSKENLKDHTNSIHINTEDLKCRFCNKSFYFTYYTHCFWQCLWHYNCTCILIITIRPSLMNGYLLNAKSHPRVNPNWGLNCLPYPPPPVLCICIDESKVNPTGSWPAGGISSKLSSLLLVICGRKRII